MKKVLLLLLLIPFVSFSQGKLKKAKQNINQNSTKTTASGKRVVKSSSSSNSKSTSHSSLPDDLGFYSFIAKTLFWGTAGIAIGEAEERDLNPYPYFYDNEGEYAAELSDTGRKQGVKLGANYLFNTIRGIELNATYKPIPIIGIDASYIHFSEKNRTNNDALDITSIMVNYHRVREKNISLWWGLGITHVGNEVNKSGFTYGLGAEIYPFKPISIHISWKESFVNKSDIGVFKSQLKYHFKNKSFFMGYHHHQIAGENISAPIVGFEITF
ncbi:hypothetical protein CXF68_02285 [Tenacibaculum sp. Bg11-29]|uniref:hypothetical protein n=1 Tax=Tenacibaculum sp. Bg11-29 TaxID=2058306 RepID=UPI000C341852|nr:hypothetical protein [Tenacibaculum sp. Bg11-29]PKH49590.1 hypothetical protein CXF68_02285 [Tenacibaculum sp. Bg11-29]